MAAEQNAFTRLTCNRYPMDRNRFSRFTHSPRPLKLISTSLNQTAHNETEGSMGDYSLQVDNI